MADRLPALGTGADPSAARATTGGAEGHAHGLLTPVRRRAIEHGLLVAGWLFIPVSAAAVRP